MRHIAVIISALALVVTSGACTKNKNPLEVPPGSVSAAENDTIIRSVEGVTVKAEVDAWDGNQRVLDKVTPVKLTIENDSTESLRLDYKNFKLVSNDGTVYHALPPFEIEGSVGERRAVGAPIGNPHFYYSGYMLAPYYGGVYPGIEVYTGSYEFDPVYYDTWYRTWLELQVPTDEMLRNAMPEGVLSPGGHVIGFLYFQKVSDDKDSARFFADLYDAIDNEIIGTAEMRFLVNSG